MTEPDKIQKVSSEKFEPHGILVIDKPPGPTSFDCIRFLKRTCNLPKKWKIGHLGTLDPFASGVMVIALGKAVRYAMYGLHSEKEYRARL
jgi:tRNA pseudouridine55 synthase